MYWEEQIDTEAFQTPENVVDLHFKIDCPRIPVDHGWALGAALMQVLPWLGDEPQAGVHNIHGAESGNGWERPEASDAVIYLSKRTPLVLRLPRHRLQDAEALIDTDHSIGGHLLQIGKPKRRPLSKAATLYARHIASPEGEHEDAFLQWTIGQLQGLSLRFSKVLCGRSHRIRGAEGEVLTRSLMVAGLSPPDAVRLQEEGVGPHRQYGCGLFIPHKAV